MMFKGGVLYDKLGADIGNQNPINGALATFNDRSGQADFWYGGSFVIGFFPKIGDCSVWSAYTVAADTVTVKWLN